MSVVAALAITLGTTILVGVAVVRRQLVHERFYQAALGHNDVYDRVYSEVLTDPELHDVTERLVGNVHGGVVDAASARIFTTNALHLVLPPSRLQTAVEQLLTAVLRYVRGDTAHLGGDVDVHEIVTNVHDAAIEYARSALAAAHPETLSTIESYRTAVREFVATLKTGDIPSSLPLPNASLPTAQVTDALRNALGTHLGRSVVVLIEGAVSAGDAGDALIAAATPRVTAVADAAASSVSRALDHGNFDVVHELAYHAHETQGRIGSTLDPARRAVAWLGPWTAALGFALVLAGMGALLFVHRRRWAYAFALVALALVVAGLVVNGLWLVARHGVHPPLGPATGTGPGTWNLTTGVRSVVRDVEGTLADELQTAVWRMSLVPIFAGGAIAVALTFARLRATRAVRVRVGVVGLAAAAVALFVATVVLPQQSNAHTCDGHAQLCGRQYDKVVQAATHNAMSSPDVVQIWPEQDLTIGEQLDLGVRTLLVDVHHWPAIASPEALSRLEPALTPEASRFIMSIVPDRFRAHPGLYLCHSQCALGGIPFGDGLAQVRSFLAANPREIVTLIIEDHVARAEIVRALEAAGLAKYAYSHSTDRAWPTLGELIDRNERLVVFAEDSGPPPAWYQSAFAEIADTPFGFPSASAMTCAENRGPAGAPLFLINHWISGPAPDRATALAVNKSDVIVDRARRCERERGRTPTFIAVDFANLGGVVAAVDDLNDVGG